MDSPVTPVDAAVEDLVAKAIMVAVTIDHLEDAIETLRERENDLELKINELLRPPTAS